MSESFNTSFSNTPEVNWSFPTFPPPKSMLMNPWTVDKPRKTTYPQYKPPKTALMLLNEKYPIANNLMQWEGVVQNNKPGFRCTLTLEGKTFVAEGSSKKITKQVLALEAIKVLLHPSFLLGITDLAESEKRPLDSILDSTDSGSSIGSSRKKRKKAASDVPSSSQENVRYPPIEGKNAVQIFHEYCVARGPDCKPEINVTDVSLPESKPSERRYLCIIKIQGQTFEGAGGGRKQAKLDAVKKV